jgi:hypothetical protein
MPVVPGPRVATAPLRGGKFSPGAPSAAFGVQATPDLSAPTALASQMYQQERQEAEDTQLVSLDNQLHELKGSVEQDTLEKFKGIGALGAKDAASEAWNEKVSALAGGIKSDRVRGAFERRAATHYGDLLSTVESHAHTEYKAAQIREFASAVDNRTNDAAKYYADPDKRDQAIADGKMLIGVFAQHSGWSPDETRHRLEEFASATHASVIEAMVNEHQDVPALAYLTAHRGELQGKDLAMAERLTGEASVLGEGQRQADRITATAPTLTVGLEQAAKLDNPRVREATEHRVRQHFADVAAADRAQKQQAFATASAILERTNGNFDAIPLRLREAMDPQDNIALQHRSDQIRHPKEPGDPETYFHLLNLASLSPESRQQFLKEDILSYKGLSTTERQKLMTIQREYSVRAEGVTEHHQSREMLREAEAEEQRTNHLQEAALRATDPAAAEALRAENFRKRQAKYHGAHPPAAPAAKPPEAVPNPTASLLTPAMKPTPAMLQDVATKGPGYAKYLRDMGYAVP